MTMKMTMAEFVGLEPCPFCGGEARHYAPGPIDHHIECVECYADIHRDTEAEAIAAWNSRAERTCKPTEEYCCQCGQDLVLCDMGIGPNGGAVELDPPILFNYCPNCGARRVGE